MALGGFLELEVVSVRETKGLVGRFPMGNSGLFVRWEGAWIEIVLFLGIGITGVAVLCFWR